MQKSCTDSRELGATPRPVLSCRGWNIIHLILFPNSRTSRPLALSTREVAHLRTRLKLCPKLIPICLKSTKRVLEMVAIGRWLNIQCILINPLNGEPLTFDLFCRREVPTGTQARASSFFSGATGTIVSGPAHFANTSGAQVAVHIHRTSCPLEFNLYLMRIKSLEPPANFMKIGEQLNPAVSTEEPQTFRGFLD